VRILLIGSGGREHAMAWKMAQSPYVDKIFCAPGNGGTYDEYKCENVNLEGAEELIKFVKENCIDLTVVGPEEPLINGIVDIFKEEGLKIFGPSKMGALLEGSKSFAKDFMRKYGVKTADYAVFDDVNEAIKYVEKASFPIVIKADGIAAGKGVVICQNFFEAESTLMDFIVNDIFKGSGKRVVIEEYLQGVEASILSITDGNCIVPFVSAKDHKQIFDGDLGPNTGGMGSIAPNPYCTEEVLEQFNKNILVPTLTGLKEESMDFHGIIFFGLMITSKGVYLLEYNVRMGDPETQSVLSLMDSDFTVLIENAVSGTLEEFPVTWKKGSACCVVAASGGYPGQYIKDYDINLDKSVESKVFIAGASNIKGSLRTSGGRVLSVTSVRETLEEAIQKTYADLERIHFKDIYYRKDIGKLY
jgi:phosphoribosylamine---glycine ligase